MKKYSVEGVGGFYISLQGAVSVVLGSILNEPYFDTLSANERHAAALEWITVE